MIKIILTYCLALPTFNLASILHISYDFLKSGIKWLATKALVIGAITILIPLVLFNVWGKILETILSIQSGYLQDGTGIISQGLDLTGLSAWFATVLRFPESFSIIISAISIRLILSFIKR